MHDNIAKNILNELTKIRQALGIMNANHEAIGKLFMKWNEVGEPVELEMDGREAFVISQAVRCIDITSVHYKHVGTVDALENTGMRVRFVHTQDWTYQPVLTPDQLEVLPQPKLKIGDKVRVIDPHSIVYKEIGEVSQTAFEGTEVKFPSGSGGDFNRRNLELVEAYETELEIDDIVRVTEPGSVAYDHVGTIIGFRKDGTIRVLFADKKGYQIFIEAELTKIGEQPYKEN